MSDILRQLYNECDPAEPAPNKYYTDLSQVRGGDTFIHTFCEELSLSERRVHTLFTGHSGCGKSSELKKLEYELATEQPQHDHHRYFPIYLDCTDYVDIFDASVEEIMLAIVTEVASRFREEVQIELKNTALAKLMNGVVEIARGTRLTKDTIDLKFAKLELGLNRADASIRNKVREHLAPRTTTLLDEINTLFIDARTQLRAKINADGTQTYHDFLLILDNLEKIERIGDKAQGEDSYRALFIEGGQQFTRLECNAILTVHLSIARAEGNELAKLYGREPLVLPNVKVETRGTHAPWELGRQALRDLLLERCLPYTLDQCIDKEALNFIITYCGGHLRHFFQFIRQATVYSGTAPISLDAAERAVYHAVPTFSNGAEAKWDLLAQLETDPKQRWDTQDEAKRKLMEQVFVLEYLNGDAATKRFNKIKPWYAVHPIARELEEFQEAVAARRKVQT